MEDNKGGRSRFFNDGVAALQKAIDDKSAHLCVSRYASALRAIIERADNGALGSSKVQDMRKLAQAALGERDPR